MRVTKEESVRVRNLLFFRLILAERTIWRSREFFTSLVSSIMLTACVTDIFANETTRTLVAIDSSFGSITLYQSFEVSTRWGFTLNKFGSSEIG